MFEALVVWFVLAVPWVLGYATAAGRAAGRPADTVGGPLKRNGPVMRLRWAD